MTTYSLSTYSCEQVGHLRHALGLDNFKTSHRNYFAATPGSPDDAIWKGLVELGLAFHRDGTPFVDFPYNCYHCTEAGIAVGHRKVK